MQKICFPEPQQDETNPYLTDEGMLQPGLAPPNQLRKLSLLMFQLRNNQEALKEYPAWEKLEAAILDVGNDSDDLGIGAVLNAFSELLLEAVWPE